ncbi:MAG: hypothetical protein JO278_15090, partial [Dyella sp.]|nr:hypothetical protein [Dyella sp.]
MLDVHPLHGRIQGWKDFFIHIATIVVGLLIAVALEQTVEYLHHRHQVAEFEARMHEELESDAKLLDEDIRRQDAYRSYLVEIQTAIKAKLANQAYKMPPEDDARNHWGYYVPLLIPYRIAQQNGTLAHLDVDRLELYSRLELQQELILEIIHRYTA